MAAAPLISLDEPIDRDEDVGADDRRVRVPLQLRDGTRVDGDTRQRQHLPGQPYHQAVVTLAAQLCQCGSRR